MDEVVSAVLLGIYRGQSIQEIATLTSRSVSTVHDRMVWLRDQGYIEPWDARKARSKRLTADGMSWIMSQYNLGPEEAEEHGEPAPEPQG